MVEREELFACNICGDEFPVDERNADYEDLCDACVVNCHECGAAVPVDETTDGYCDSCTVLCGCCGIRTPEDHTTRDVGGNPICGECLNYNYIWSDVEDGYIHYDDAVTAEDTGRTASADYARDEWYYSEHTGYWYEDRPADVLNYGANVFSHFEWDSRNARNALVFGVEVEMEPRRYHSGADVAEALDGPVSSRGYILKEDGSLDDGVELVTVPLTLDQHREEFGWNEIFTPELRKIAMSGSGTTNCGIHIHVNRRALSALTLGKVMVFVNSPKTDALVTTIAQRESNGFAARVEKKVTDGLKPTDRYERLNVTGKGTVEFRLFRGNLRPERVLKNLEFCHSVIKFARATSARDMERPDLYLSWLENHRKDYPNLHSFLVEKGWLEAAKAA